jgi:hypothetical protein
MLPEPFDVLFFRFRHGISSCPEVAVNGTNVFKKDLRH